MFTLTEEWLHRYYGSKDGYQESEAVSWLRKWGKDVPEGKILEWSKWKHLVEYQVNTLDIVPRALSMIGKDYETELETHLQINLLRCPVHAASYLSALEVVPNVRYLLELGTGGDSSISTSVFLRHCEKTGGSLWSVDLNPLGATRDRYENVPYWFFTQSDSLVFLDDKIQNNIPFDLIFIDTIHSYKHTLEELLRSEKLTANILLDDATFEGNDFDPDKGGVKRAIQEWEKDKLDKWDKYVFGCDTVVLFVRRQ